MSGIAIVLEPDPEDADTSSATGLTTEAFERLSEVLVELGYLITEGPVRA